MTPPIRMKVFIKPSVSTYRKVVFIQEAYNICKAVQLKELSLFLLMYADDMVIFWETKDGCKKCIIYTKKWKLTVNIDKTKIVVCIEDGLVKKEDN